MGVPVPIYFQGRHWPSKKDCLQELGLHPMSLDRYLAQGLTEIPTGPGKGRRVKVKWRGSDYESAAAASRATGDNWKTVAKWARRGFDEPQAPVRKRRYWKEPKTFDGREWWSARDIAEHYGVHLSNVKSWLARGHTEPPVPRPKLNIGPYEFEGRTWDRMEDIAKHIGVTRQQVCMWIQAGHKSRPSRGNAVQFEMGGIIWENQRACARHFGACTKTVKRWRDAGLTEPPAKYTRRVA